MGGFEVFFLEKMDPSVKYHSVKIYILTCSEKNEREHYLVGSFSGALSS